MGYFRGCFSAFSPGRSLVQRIVVHQHGGQLGAVGGAVVVKLGAGGQVAAEGIVGEGLMDPADAGLKIAPGGVGQVQFKMLIRQ